MKKRPHEHITHPRSIVFFAIIAVFLFIGALFHSVVLKNSDLLGSIYPRVLVSLANSDRQASSLGVLTTNSTLEEVARMKAEDMATRGYFSHNTPEGEEPWYWFRKAGYEYEYAGENLAINFSDSEEVQKAWMNSPTHRANIMNGKFAEVGIATAEGTYQGRSAVFVVQSFGTPKKKVVTPTEVFAVESTKVGEVDTREISEEEINEETTKSTATSTFLAEVDTTDVAGVETSFAETRSTKPSFWDMVLTNPEKVVSIFYSVMGGAVLLSLILILFSEIKHHHLRSAMVSSFFIILLITLFVVYRYSIFSGFAIG